MGRVGVGPCAVAGADDIDRPRSIAVFATTVLKRSMPLGRAPCARRRVGMDVCGIACEPPGPANGIEAACKRVVVSVTGLDQPDSAVSRARMSSA